MDNEIKAVEFIAEVRQIRTMVDGSVNLILNIPEPFREHAKKLIDWHNLQVRCLLELTNVVDGGEYGL